MDFILWAEKVVEPWGVTPLGKWTEVSVVVGILGLTILGIWRLVASNEKQRIDFINAWKKDAASRAEAQDKRLDKLEEKLGNILKEYHQLLEKVIKVIDERNVLVRDYMDKSSDLISRLAISPCLLMHPQVNATTRRRVLVELGILTRADHKKEGDKEKKEKDISPTDTWTQDLNK